MSNSAIERFTSNQVRIERTLATIEALRQELKAAQAEQQEAERELLEVLKPAVPSVSKIYKLDISGENQAYVMTIAKVGSTRGVQEKDLILLSAKELELLYQLKATKSPLQQLRDRLRY